MKDGLTMADNMVLFVGTTFEDLVLYFLVEAPFVKMVVVLLETKTEFEKLVFMFAIDGIVLVSRRPDR